MTTSELDQLASSSFIAYRHDHGRMATLAHDGWVRVFAPGEAEQQWDLLAQIQVDAGRLIQVCAFPSFPWPPTINTMHGNDDLRMLPLCACLPAFTSPHAVSQSLESCIIHGRARAHEHAHEHGPAPNMHNVAGVLGAC